MRIFVTSVCSKLRAGCPGYTRVLDLAVSRRLLKGFFCMEEFLDVRATCRTLLSVNYLLLCGSLFDDTTDDFCFSHTVSLRLLSRCY